MGQCYTVEAKLIFKGNDPTAFCDVVIDEIRKRHGISAEFDLKRGNLKDPFDCFRTLTSENARIMAKKDKSQEIWEAEFDASYGWESVMFDIFKAALSTCENGSYVKVWPDSDSWKLVVKDNEVVLK